MGADWECPFEEIPVGKGRCLRQGTDVAVLSYGPIGNDVVKAIDRIEQGGQQLSVAHYDMRFCKPLDEELLESIASAFRRVVTVEDAQRAGGFGSAILEWMSDHDKDVTVKRVGLPDRFIEHGTVEQLRHIAGTDVDAIVDAITNTSNIHS